MLNVSQFQVAKFQALFAVGAEGLLLPEFKGATFRGVFGRALKEAACFCSSGTHDWHESGCIYAYLFETKLHLETGQIVDAARPFILEPPLIEKKWFAPGEKIVIGFSLFGKAIHYLPYFVEAMKKMAEHGLGKENHPLVLLQIFSERPNGSLECIYHNHSTEISNFTIISGQDLAEKFKSVHSEDLSVYFITPTSFKVSGRMSELQDFHILLRSAVRRLSSILYTHHDHEYLDINFSEMFEKARKIIISKSEVEWREWERYSHRQNQRIQMGGFIGKVDYKGDLSPYLPWLMLAEHVNVGKNATFGLGKIKIQP